MANVAAPAITQSIVTAVVAVTATDPLTVRMTLPPLSEPLSPMVTVVALAPPPGIDTACSTVAVSAAPGKPPPPQVALTFQAPAWVLVYDAAAAGAHSATTSAAASSSRGDTTK